MNPYPVSWPEIRDRLAFVLAGVYPAYASAEAGADDLLSEAMDATYGMERETMTAEQRRDAYARSAATVMALEDTRGSLAFTLGARAILRDAFARHFDGVVVDGPPWRLGPDELDRPLYDDWRSAADFGVTPA